MKKLITMALTVGMALSMAACGGNSGSAGTTAAAAGSGESKAEVSADAKKLLYVHGASDTSILQTTAEYFKSLIEERTDGRYTVEIHPNFELGSLTESVQMIKSGDVQLSGVCLGSYYSDALAIVDLPNAVPTIRLCGCGLRTCTRFRIVAIIPGISPICSCVGASSARRTWRLPRRA